jgi:NAD(P)H-nitrite reductase large subunit
MRKYIIIGAGVAGIAASEAIHNYDPEATILMISEEPVGYYSRPGLAYYLTGEVKENLLFPFSNKDYQNFNIQLVNSGVKKIHPKYHQVELNSGAMLPYNRLLIATGSYAATSRVPGSDLEGVVKLDNLDDARHILKLACKARSAVVVGGGITALELVEGFRARGLKTHYLLRKDRYWSNVLDETESEIIERRLREEGVIIHYHTELGEIIGDNGRVTAIKTTGGRSIRCELVAVAIGVLPRCELARNAGMRLDRGILVDECMQTSQQDIFAAGDVAQVYDPFTGSSVLDTLWGPAREQGYVAGSNMAGVRMRYCRSAAFNVTRLAGLTTTIIGSVGKGSDEDLLGIARGDSETWRQLPDAIAAQNEFEFNRLRLLVGEKTLVGAVVMGDQTLSRPIQDLITFLVDISPYRSQLLEQSQPLSDLIVDIWMDWKRHYDQQGI